MSLFLLPPEEIIDKELYINQIDYGIFSHPGIRMNPFKLFSGVSYNSLGWEPDSKFADRFIGTYDRNYNQTGVVH